MSTFASRLRSTCACLALASILPSGPRYVAPSDNAVRHVHDPTIVRDGPDFYLFSTGPGIMVRRSSDLAHWAYIGRVFQEDVPAWARRDVPGASAVWAPEVVRFGGRFHAYYTVSTYGSNRSIIGKASSKTLDPRSPDYGWQDDGKVAETRRGDDYNAIDACVAMDRGKPVGLALGSFWSGIKLVALDPTTGVPKPGAPLTPIASRPPPGAIEAPYLLRRGGYWYLFVSFDLCCRGVDSTYHIRVGRSRALEGPYTDRSGKPMLDSGGTLLLEAQGRWVGPGHCMVLVDRGREWLVHHAYDREAKGVPTLQVRPLTWDSDGWPAAGDSIVEVSP